jgi:hypothetical protein
MGRAWRNIIDEFDDGTLKWYQNDTNIVRHIETKGKWLYLPRVLYQYYYSDDTFSREPNRTAEQFAEIEGERLFIESKFPYLNNPDKVTCSLYYLPIKSQSRDFSLGDFNKSKERKKILYIKSNIKSYERQLLKELFYDHDLYFDYTLNMKFDEVIVSLDTATCFNLPQITQVLQETNTDTHIKLRLDERLNPAKESIHSLVNSLYGSYGWVICGYETYFITAI